MSPFWDGEGAHVDFTHPAGIAWWKQNLREQVLDLEIDASVTAELIVIDLVWDIQVYLPTGIVTPMIGTISVVADVTQAVT